MDDQELGCLRNILEYMEEQEQNHFEECSEEERKNHIYNDVVVVRKWLDGRMTKTIDVPVTKLELQELMNGKKFLWNFDVVDVNIYKEEEED